MLLLMLSGGRSTSFNLSGSTHTKYLLLRASKGSAPPLQESTVSEVAVLSGPDLICSNCSEFRLVSVSVYL